MHYTRLLIAALIAPIAGCNSSSSTPPDLIDNTATISTENAETLLREIIKIANNETLDAASASLEPVFDTIENLIDQAILNGVSSGNGLTFVSTAALSEDGGLSEYTFSCDSGGTLVARAYKDDSAGSSLLDKLVASDTCSIDDATYEGSAYKVVRFVRGTDVSTFENFSVSHADGDSLLLNGEFSDSSPEQRGPTVVIDWTDANLQLVDGGEATTVDAYNSYRRSNVESEIPGTPTPGATASASFTVTAPWSAGLPLEVVMDLAFIAEENPIANEQGLYPENWQTGSLRVTAEDGTGLTLSPDTGDEATFSVTVDGVSGDPMIFNWADGFQVFCAKDYQCN